MIGELFGAGVGMCVNSLLTNAVHAITPATVSKLTKIGCSIGAMAVSGVFAKMVKEDVDEQIEEFKTNVNKEKKKLEEAKLANEGEG